MPARPTRLLAAFLAAALTGCTLATTTPAAKRTTPPRTGGTPKPGPELPDPVAGLTGVVRLVSNNGGAVISNNGGSILSDNGAGVIANNGASYRGLFAAKAAESLLADALIAFVDASGKAVTGADGQPLTARTDRQGRYRLAAAPPRGNLVMRVKLWSGGELSAILPAGAATQNVDTASSLGAAFVLERLVKGDQALLDKVPAAEASRLQRELEASRALLDAPPAYDAASLAASADDLRRKAPTVDTAIKAIEALLLGQKNLGDGRPAVEVPLNRAYGVVVDADGTVLIAESGLGRIRSVSPDGRIGTYADAVRGVVKRNIIGVRDLVRAPDGTLWAAHSSKKALHRIGTDGTVEQYTDGPLGELDVKAIGMLPDGTLLVAGGHPYSEFGRKPHWLMRAPDGTVRDGAKVTEEDGFLSGIAGAADGGIYFLLTRPPAGEGTGWRGSLHHQAPGGVPRLMVDGLKLDSEGDVRVGPDGRIYVAENKGGRVLVFTPDGRQEVVAGPGAGFLEPVHVTAAADGTLYVSDLGTALVYARNPAGVWRVLAGVDGVAQGGDGRTLALNTPSSLDFDRQGRLLVAENGRHRVLRYDAGRLEVIAGTSTGFGGDGGPAANARFSGLTTIRVRGDELFILDTQNRRLRKVGADGVVSSLAGQEANVVGPPDAAPFPALKANMSFCLDLAFDGAGRPYWTDVRRHQILRLAAPDRVEAVVGALAPVGLTPTLENLMADDVPALGDAATATLRMPLSIAFDPAGALYVSDSAHMEIRKITGIDTATPRIEAFAGRGISALPELLADPSLAARDGQRRDTVLVAPGGLCFDPAGNMYLGELGTRRLDMMQNLLAGGFGFDVSALPPISPRIRKITPDGRVTTIAGPGGRFFQDPDAEDALVMPTAIAYAPDGRLVIADPGANLVRILPAGSF